MIGHRSVGGFITKLVHSTDPAGCQCGKVVRPKWSEVFRIINGGEAGVGEYPWQVWLGDCGGSLINSQESDNI